MCLFSEIKKYILRLFLDQRIEMEKDIRVKYENTLGPQVRRTIWENAYKSTGPADIREDRRTFEANLSIEYTIQYNNDKSF